jgi:hypothetical protein
MTGCLSMPASAANTDLLAFYEELVSRALPCTEPVLTDIPDFHVCLLVVPSGHRLNERELLVTLSRSGQSTTMTIAEPYQALWQVSLHAIREGQTLDDTIPKVRVRMFETTDTKLITRVMGSWHRQTTRIVSDTGLFSDPTWYRIQTWTSTGQTDVQLAGPGAITTRQPTPLLTWAEGVRRRARATLDEKSPVQAR